MTILDCQDYTFARYIIKFYSATDPVEYIMVKIFRGKIQEYKKTEASKNPIFKPDFHDYSFVAKDFNRIAYMPFSLRHVIYSKEIVDEDVDGFPYFSVVAISQSKFLTWYSLDPIDMSIKDKDEFRKGVEKFVSTDPIYNEWSDIISQDLLYEVRDSNLDQLI